MRCQLSLASWAYVLLLIIIHSRQIIVVIRNGCASLGCQLIVFCENINLVHFIKKNTVVEWTKKATEHFAYIKCLFSQIRAIYVNNPKDMIKHKTYTSVSWHNLPKWILDVRIHIIPTRQNNKVFHCTYDTQKMNLVIQLHKFYINVHSNFRYPWMCNCRNCFVLQIDRSFISLYAYHCAWVIVLFPRLLSIHGFCVWASDGNLWIIWLTWCI